MASTLLTKALISNPTAFRNSTGLFCAAIRNHWNYQYKPGPYPKTPEERAAAAKKYNLSIEEYKTFREEDGYGDYPKLPNISGDAKDPFYQWDCPELKRNFNEPLNVLTQIIGEDRYDISKRPRYPVWRQSLWFFGVITTFFTIYYVLEDYKMGRPVAAKQYPNEGPHYTFSA